MIKYIIIYFSIFRIFFGQVCLFESFRYKSLKSLLHNQPFIVRIGILILKKYIKAVEHYILDTNLGEKILYSKYINEIRWRLIILAMDYIKVESIYNELAPNLYKMISHHIIIKYLNIAGAISLCILNFTPFQNWILYILAIHFSIYIIVKGSIYLFILYNNWNIHRRLKKIKAPLMLLINCLLITAAIYRIFWLYITIFVSEQIFKSFGVNFQIIYNTLNYFNIYTVIENFSLIAIFAPFISFLIVITLGRYLGRHGSIITTLIGITTSLILSIILFYNIALKQTIINIKLYQWISLGTSDISFGFWFDSLTCVMLFVVSLVSTLVHLYSIDYMSHDPHISRFMAYLSLFSFFMLILISADNFMQLFLGWEGVGLASYLLINFWYTRIEASKAAIKAIIMNRLGDFGLCLAIIAIYFLCNSLDFSIVFSTISEFKDAQFLLLDINYLTFISILLFIGAVGKSAQIGLHTWLPDAMEGPTPVSALIHAATMVTAGVFLLIRCSPILEQSETGLTVITIVGGLTAFFASTIGVFQNDLKKVIAYSTCSQLGYMVFACGLSAYNIAIFHLVTHAFFKALLFLGAGSIIHGVSDEQDMRKMGGLIKLLPFTYICMVIGSLALAGFPFLSGYYSKELILEVALGSYTLKGMFAYCLGCTAAFFTAFYSTRLLALVFYVEPNGNRIVYSKTHDAPKFITISLFILALFSIFTGYFAKDLFVGLGTDFWTSSIYISHAHQLQIDSEFIPFYFKLIPLLFSFTGIILGYCLYVTNPEILYNVKKNNNIKKLIEFFTKKWYFDNVYNWFGARLAMKFGYDISFKALDRGLFEKFGSNGIAKAVMKISNLSETIQSGYIFHYALMIVIGIIFIILYLLNFTLLIKACLLFALFLFFIK